MKKMVLVFALLALLTGCVYLLPQNISWGIPEGVTQEQFQRDEYECKRDVGPFDLYTYAASLKMMKACMISKGYTYNRLEY